MKFTILFLTCISINLFSQAIIHPKKFGFGYHYGFTLDNRYVVSAQSGFISSGNFDFLVGFVKKKITSPNLFRYSEEKEVETLSIGMNFVSIKEGRKMLPSFTVFIGSIREKFCLGIGPSITYELYDYNHVRILPEAGVSITFYDLGSRSIIGGAELAFSTDINIAVVLESVAIILSPGYSIGKDASYFIFSAGISIIPSIKF